MAMVRTVFTVSERGALIRLLKTVQQKLLIGAVGNITAGFGKFAGLEGTYTYCGALMPDRVLWQFAVPCD